MSYKSKQPSSRRCTSLTKSGRPCRAWALRGSEPPLCRIHAGRRAYNQGLLTMGLVDMHSDWFVKEDLDVEVAIVRAVMGYAFADLDEAETPAERVRLGALLLRGAGTLATLLRTNRKLMPEEAGVVEQIFDRALDRAAAELGMDL
ncbi:MAG: hypothetical protein R3300_07565 [Candidatus Promineifilaceae bacterium]|nr:hypothetical protein [Candidatus Promineifilaceae bacterium]